MKKQYILPYGMFVCLILWFTLLFIQIFHIKSSNEISRFAAQAEFVVHAFMLTTVFKIYKSVSKANRRIMIWFVVAALFLFVNDLSFYAITYFKNTLSINVPIIPFLIDLIPFFTWVFAISIFFFIMLTKAIPESKHYLKMLFPLILMDLIIISLFLSSIHYAFSILSAETISQASTFIVQLMVFDFAILCLIYSESKGFSLLLSGFVILICGDYFLIYSFISQTDTLLAYGELLWLLGLLIILFGVLYLRKEGSHNLTAWVRKNTNIKSKLTIWFFSGSIISFLLLFILAYIFSIISKEVFLSLPLFIMLYSIIVISFSVFMGRYFEAPFKKLENNIRGLMHEDDIHRLDNNFSTEEFIFLQKFIVEAFEFKEAKDLAQKELGRMTAQVAHDIRSPLSALNACLRHLPQIPENQRILMHNAANRINDIANNLLQQYKHTDAKPSEKLRVWLLAPLVESIISEKRLQFEGNPIGLEEAISSEGFAAFAKFDAHGMKRLVSNLINNAAEAFAGKAGKITLELHANTKQIFFNIKDNGCGIPEDQLEAVLKPGVSFKSNGSGLGLSHAKEAIESYSGTLSIRSVLKKGTTVLITLPRAKAPDWFVSEILVSPLIPIGVLDDDQSVHDAWDQCLLSASQNLNIHHFKTPQSFEDWYKLQNEEVQVFSDYELLGEAKTGLDVLEGLKIKNAILVTSHYENPAIINRCQILNTHLLPKNLLAHIPIRLIQAVVQADEVGQKCQTDKDILLDAVLIDDSDLMRQSWELVATLQGKQILAFASMAEFEKQKSVIHFRTPIYIDSELGDNLKGEEYAKILFEEGFKEIYLVTGYPESHFPAMPWLKGIINKDPSF